MYATLAAHCKENASGATLDSIKEYHADVGGGKLEVALDMLVGARLARRDRQRLYRLIEQSATGDAICETARDLVAKAAGQFEQMSAHDYWQGDPQGLVWLGQTTDQASISSFPITTKTAHHSCGPLPLIPFSKSYTDFVRESAERNTSC